MLDYFQLKLPVLPKAYQNKVSVIFIHGHQAERQSRHHDSQIILDICLSFLSDDNKIKLKNNFLFFRLTTGNLLRKIIDHKNAEKLQKEYLLSL